MNNKQTNERTNGRTNRRANKRHGEAHEGNKSYSGTLFHSFHMREKLSQDVRSDCEICFVTC
ncbi:hypothetical protein HELRODRAFT_193812 [Helobdella robusta]|uniref:Uncharacterized protein n=1 Tax=Helobdella robusta TaxID=6412 RepID=T1FVD8_HELRO|nr:hypothetical protein HELRODRAFT_193812 [Helobdella robusta]ESN94040.1 hypothetical protein HELRODRAFT_193812 [Helobdella robusta]